MFFSLAYFSSKIAFQLMNTSSCHCIFMCVSSIYALYAFIYGYMDQSDPLRLGTQNPHFYGPDKSDLQIKWTKFMSLHPTKHSTLHKISNICKTNT